ncbi:tail fiber protein [Thermus phage G20c]|nr:tail fiber protein [Thermus phage G20c]
MSKLVVVRIGHNRDMTPARRLVEALRKEGATCVRVWGRLRSRLHTQIETRYDLASNTWEDELVEYPLGLALVLEVQGLSRKKLKQVLRRVGTGYWPRVRSKPSPLWRRA